MREADLLDSPQALKVRMFNQFKNDPVWNADESVYGVIEYFLTVHDWLFSG
jgi:hypothetical protein